MKNIQKFGQTSPEKKEALPDAENWAQSKNKIDVLILD